jgi:hypothetical protein
MGYGSYESYPAPCFGVGGVRSVDGGGGDGVVAIGGTFVTPFAYHLCDPSPLYSVSNKRYAVVMDSKIASCHVHKGVNRV